MQTNVLEQVKRVELSILVDVAALCDKHDLTYYLIGGTLLGAIRHDGFIPWDDDIDIAMPRKDFETFQKIAQTELPESLFLHYGTTDPDYYLPIIKIKKNGTIFEEQSASSSIKHKGIFIDIFPLDNANTNTGFRFHTKGMLIKQIKNYLFLKINQEKQLSAWKKAILNLTKPIPASFVFQLLTKYMQTETSEDAPFYVNYGSQYGYKKQTMPKEMYDAPSKTTFEDQLFKIPRETPQLLERIYGKNYMDIPPASKRITHNPKRIQLNEECMA
ncbi:phosphorylcholine transferase LicD [Listeria booriae]|uniref:LicD/FKTN/FKRP nucleotidyltransferase domain-containing protein n=1 Tax=Listeria booriae TaxID=1552123 RepID=A0A099WD04_9LIST|nr:LicD family protein [Listeria booriae]KGL42536.1 hypothetical protein EP57_03490 [Listeria booriae]MBC2205877.1 LicD family protein [Listeria booriae]STY40763.1 LPS biosynthesis protein [Listeria booriae]